MDSIRKSSKDGGRHALSTEMFVASVPSNYILTTKSRSMIYISSIDGCQYQCLSQWIYIVHKRKIPDALHALAWCEPKRLQMRWRRIQMLPESVPHRRTSHKFWRNVQSCQRVWRNKELSTGW